MKNTKKKKIEKIEIVEIKEERVIEWQTNHHPSGSWEGAGSIEEKLDMLVDKINEIIDKLK